MKPQAKRNRHPKEQLIIDNLPYVKRIVNRIAIHLPPSVEVEDLVNAGVIGLISAAERFDPSRDKKFITYAAFRIRGAVLSELRSRDYLSRSNRRKIREMERAVVAIEKRLGREAEDEEVARELDISLDDLYDIKKLAGISFISLEDLGYSSRDDRDSLRTYLVDNRTGNAFAHARLREIENTVAEAINALPEKEKLVVSLYYWEELTMKEIGKVLEISESRVSQIHSKAIIHLRSKLDGDGLLWD